MATMIMGNIGKCRRQDEIGTPLCVVVDFDSLEKIRQLQSVIAIRLSGVKGLI